MQKAEKEDDRGFAGQQPSCYEPEKKKTTTTTTEKKKKRRSQEQDREEREEKEEHEGGEEKDCNHSIAIYGGRTVRSRFMNF